MSDPLPYFVHPTSTDTAPFYVQPYTTDTFANTNYATDAAHPSDVMIGKDNQASMVDDSVYQDNIYAVGSSTSGYSKSASRTTYFEFMKTQSFGSGGHSFGYASCQWLRGCTSSESTGSACSATLSGVDYNGYCFNSDTGSLECGRLAALDNEYGENPIIFDNVNNLEGNWPAGKVRGLYVNETVLPTYASSPGTIEGNVTTNSVHRCPMGNPAKTLGTFVSKRPLIAGCMIASDASYDISADIHVPAYCTATADYMKGCMIPAAVNFDPSAKQVSACRFKSYGCTDSSAVNYNELATDTDGSCITKKEGCTVMSDTYTSVDGAANSGTPNYKSLRHYDSARWINSLPKEEAVRADTNTKWYTSQTVNNYDSTANVNVGCVVAIEGCTDETAANYDANANVNTGTWCVPKITGCMLPGGNAANAGWAPGSPREGLALTFAYGATVHDKAMCVGNIAHYGCTDQTASNYDPAANKDSDMYPCYYSIIGCLNPTSNNYGCKVLQNTACPLDTYALSDRPTLHNAALCSWIGGRAVGAPNAPPPPAPLAPPGFSKAVEVLKVRFEMKVAGAPEENLETGTAMMNILLSTRFAGIACLDLTGKACNSIGAFCIEVPQNCGRRLEAEELQSFSRRLQGTGTTTFKFEAVVASTEAAAALTAAISGSDNSAAALQALFQDSGITLTVQSGATVASFVDVEFIVDDGSSGVTVGIIVGCLVAIIIGGAVVMAKRQKTMRKTEVVPA